MWACIKASDGLHSLFRLFDNIIFVRSWSYFWIIKVSCAFVCCLSNSSRDVSICYVKDYFSQNTQEGTQNGLPHLGDPTSRTCFTWWLIILRSLDLVILNWTKLYLENYNLSTNVIHKILANSMNFKTQDSTLAVKDWFL